MAKGKKKKKGKKLPPLLKVLLIVVGVLIVGYCVVLGVVYNYVKRVDEAQKESLDEFANVFITQLEDEDVLTDPLIKDIFDGNEHKISEISKYSLFGKQILDAYNGRSYKDISRQCVHDSTASAMLSIIYHSDSNEIELLLRNDYVNYDSIIKKEIYSLDKDISEYLK